MSGYLLDTNIVSAMLRDPRGPVTRRIAEVGAGEIGVSIITAAELRFGCAKKESARLTAAVDAVLGRIPVLGLNEPWDTDYARIRLALERAGTPIGPNDLLLAAHALCLDSTMVTGNEQEFARVPGLRVENWLQNER
ncbi:transcriptional regulator [Roseivivax halodurans JCM 10272]|uniref:Ribonuclease VapC n=1 Tax=Roseivivax halodurans JCM 10272 TaxID=1449350 RepID=X7EBU7_9RHOB|nr:type II toxin-antitoxin system VapC family toxin [Roseivivax halodurans]ETX13564.1 transcriptional regulator [Roseivivax halodurans JCM 10272]